ncbi:MAG: glyoxalase [Bacillota bacterium]|jgi:uncharacterized glyoxalase superfamily protein PhnB|nr:glyoxalase [Bacillota bacterium]
MTEQYNYIGVSGNYTKNGIPHGFTSITPFIVVKDPEEAISYYKAVFNVRVKDITEFTDEAGNKIVAHAELDFGNGFLQLGAANPAYQLVLPSDEAQACYSLSIYVADVDPVYKNAVEQGGKIREPIANFVSGDRFGSVIDPFGVRWTIMTRIEDLSEAESSQRVREWADSLKGSAK